MDNQATGWWGPADTHDLRMEHRIYVLNMYASHASQVHQLSAQQRTLCSFSTSVKQVR
jgi:hypothetical protein